MVSQRYELSEFGGAGALQQLEHPEKYAGQRLLSRELLVELELDFLNAQHSV